MKIVQPLLAGRVFAGGLDQCGNHCAMLTGKQGSAIGGHQLSARMGRSPAFLFLNSQRSPGAKQSALPLPAQGTIDACQHPPRRHVHHLSLSTLRTHAPFPFFHPDTTPLLGWVEVTGWSKCVLRRFGFQSAQMFTFLPLILPFLGFLVLEFDSCFSFRKIWWKHRAFPPLTGFICGSFKLQTITANIFLNFDCVQLFAENFTLSPLFAASCWQP